MAYVYLITNLINNKKYIGSSRKDSIDLQYYGSGRRIKSAIQKYGKENFTREILWEGKGDARNIEAFYLEKYKAASNPLFYNMTNDARGNTLHKDETKHTVSEKLTGRKFSKEICEKISKAKLGKPNTKKGKSDGPKPGVSVAHKGRTSPNKGKGKLVGKYSLNGKLLTKYHNMQEAAKSINLNAESIRQCLTGKSKSSGGYIWKYLY